MKKYLLIAGAGFYLLTFMCIFGMTFFFETQMGHGGGNAIIRNVNTGEKVWQPDMETFDIYAKSKWHGLTNGAIPAGFPPKPKREESETVFDHAERLRAWQDALERDVNYQITKAYGDYHKALYRETPLPSVGDLAYTETVCWHCHSQFVRPLPYENQRWGPTSQIGESAHEMPTRFGTRRIGPDLTREGGARPDDWHLAHFYDGRYTVPQSIMVPLGRISRYWHGLDRSRRDEIQAQVDERLAAEGKAINGVNGATAGFKAVMDLMDSYNENGDKVWLMWKGRLNGDIESRPIVRAVPMPKERIRGLIAYVQTRGVGIGITGKTDAKLGADTIRDRFEVDDIDWQEYIRKLDFQPGIWRTQLPMSRPTSRPEHVLAPAELMARDPAVSALPVKEQDQLAFSALKERYSLSVGRGANMFIEKCAGCHGGIEESTDAMTFDPRRPETLQRIGNGFGPAAQWMVPEPRNFHLGAWPAKTKDGKAVPPRDQGSLQTVYKNRSGNRDINLARPEDLFGTIRNGMAPSAMPAWTFLTDWEIWDLVNFIMMLGDVRGSAEAFALEKEMDFDTALATIRSRPQYPNYYDLKTVQAAFGREHDVPTLGLKPSLDDAGVDRVLASALTSAGMTVEKREEYAAAFWAKRFRGDANRAIKLDGNAWTHEELRNIGEEIFLLKVENLSSGDKTPDCKSCHGEDGDGWGARRGELLSASGFSARNFYSGQFKLGGGRDGIYRAMRYGMAGTLMNAQIASDNWATVDAMGLAEFVMEKTTQGIMGIRD